ncbi:MAG TPA: histidine kinase N-terminal 7TM domain-containing protein [Clostridia bacterium]|nr:histidine kinase N-terminal 7TM domain-containing protein [Clostridia bacterium]
MIGFLSSLLFIFGFSFFVFFLYSLSKQRNSLSAPFSIMCLAVAIYVIGYGLELRADSIEQIIFFLKLEYFGAPFMSAFWLIFAYKFHYKRKPSLKTTILIMVFPFLTLFFSVTNEFHHLIYTDVSAFEYDGYLLSILSKGIWYYVNIAYAYGIQLFGIYVFFSAWSNAEYKYGTPAYWMFFGSLWPTAVNIIYLAGLSPLSLDLTPFGLSISAICFYMALFHYDFLELREIVKDVAFSEISEGIIVIDDKNRLIDFNKACKRIFDWLDIKNIGTDVSRFKEGKELLEQTEDLFEMKFMNKNTQKYYEFRKTVLNENNKNVGFVYFIQDISKHKEMIQALNDIANYDSMTQIYNRRKLMEESEKALLQSRRHVGNISFLMLDIDHFKMVNDKYGHLAGDEVLKILANVCKDRIRRTDILGRFGGEEFLIVLPDTDKENALKVATEIKETMANTKTVFRDSTVTVTISIGISTALIADDTFSVDRLINNADIALYKAKNSGRNRICVYDDEV